MGTYEKLHLANNLDALDLLAKKDCDVRKCKFQSICNVLSKLYKESQLNVLDQEKTYILLARYLNVYKYLLSSQSDKKFVEIRFGSEYKKVLMQYEETKRSLELRYALKANTISSKPHVEENEVSMESKPQQVFDDQFISCQQLYSALQSNYNLLLVDARPENDFKDSRILYPNSINVPDHVITPGLSANTLGKVLPEETQRIWDLRDSHDAVVLYDWDTTSEKLPLTKLNHLHSALTKWDLNRSYREQPVVLDGGYLEFLQTYPTLCANPQVYLYRKNDELDELLELDSITYPTESDNKTNVMGAPEDNGVEDFSDMSRQDVLNQLDQAENEWKKINELIKQESNITNIANLRDRDCDIQAKINRLEDALKDKFGYVIDDEMKGEDKEISAPENEEDSQRLKGIIDEERNKQLKKARALKPKQDGLNGGRSNLNEQKIDRPTINRATKPTVFSYKTRPVEEIEMTSGLVGLRNIQNTCYLSTVIQCMRNVPFIRDFFCRGTYNKYIIRDPAALIHETANLIRQLWSKPVKSIDPSELLHKVGQLERTYQLGNHEDCMEFFLFLLNHLCEDCRYDIALPSVMTPKQKAWYNQFEGKNSVFIDNFYHQIRIIQNCYACDHKTYKFEIESTFMLSVPEHEFSLDALMKDYMADFVIPDYCCCKCKKPVINQKEICYEPKIMVIVLKRYRQVIVNGAVEVEKINSKVNFHKKDFRLGNQRYNLNAIALHSGSVAVGHYTAAALTSKGWYEFNDEIVRPINVNDESLKIKACAFFYSMCDD